MLYPNFQNWLFNLIGLKKLLISKSKVEYISLKMWNIQVLHTHTSTSHLIIHLNLTKLSLWYLWMFSFNQLLQTDQHLRFILALKEFLLRLFQEYRPYLFQNWNLKITQILENFSFIFNMVNQHDWDHFKSIYQRSKTKDSIRIEQIHLMLRFKIFIIIMKCSFMNC